MSTTRTRRMRLGLAAVAASLIALSIRLDAAALVAIPVFFLLIVPFEKLFPRHRQGVRREGLGTDLAYAASQPLLGAIGVGFAVVVAFASLAWLPGLALRPLVAALPPVAQLVAGLVLFDLVGYWAHRWAHEVPFLWRFHAVHHSTRHLDWISGIRAHPADGALIAPAFIFLLAAGFSPEATGVLAVLQFFVGLFLHANVRWRLRPLHRIVATPEFHHWHHADEVDAHSSNYSAILPIWDVLFGTWFLPADRRPERYGVSTIAVPDGMVEQLAFPLRGLPGPRWILRHPLQSVRRTWRALGRGLRQLWASTTRPRNRPLVWEF